MQGKELIHDMINTYFMLATMILAVMAILGSHFMPEVRLGYEHFSLPLIYAAYGTVPNIVMYAKKELTMKELLIRKIIQLILVEAIVISVALPAEIIRDGQKEIVMSLAISILIIYVLTHIVEWFQDCITAKKMTEELLRFQEKQVEKEVI